MLTLLLGLRISRGQRTVCTSNVKSPFICLGGRIKEIELKTCMSLYRYSFFHLCLALCIVADSRSLLLSCSQTNTCVCAFWRDSPRAVFFWNKHMEFFFCVFSPVSFKPFVFFLNFQFLYILWLTSTICIHFRLFLHPTKIFPWTSSLFSFGLRKTSIQHDHSLFPLLLVKSTWSRSFTFRFSATHTYTHIDCDQGRQLNVDYLIERPSPYTHPRRPDDRTKQSIAKSVNNTNTLITSYLLA